MTRRVRCLVNFSDPNYPTQGSIYTVRREGEDLLFLEEIEGGLTGIHKCYFEDVIEEPVTTSAIKHDGDKPRMELLSSVALFAIARVMTKGAIKYSPHNWRLGFKWSRLLGAALRHLFLYLAGQDKDEETGESHLAHAGCCIMMLLEHEIEGLGEDDRYKKAP